MNVELQQKDSKILEVYFILEATRLEELHLLQLNTRLS